MLMVLLMAPLMKGWAAAIIRMWEDALRKRLPIRPQGLAQSKTGQMLVLEMRRALDRHGAAAIVVGGLDLLPGEAQRPQHLEAWLVELGHAQAQPLPAEGLAEREAVEGVLDVERGRQGRLEPCQRLVVEAARPKALVVHERRTVERAAANGVADDLVDLGLAVAQRLERLRDHAVDDLEVAAAGELLELDQREIGLDPGGVAVHDEADRAGGRYHRHLGIAHAVPLGGGGRLVPGLPGGRDEPRHPGSSRHRAARAGCADPHSRSPRSRRPGDDCEARAEPPRGSRHSPGTGPAPRPSRPRPCRRCRSSAR